MLFNHTYLIVPILLCNLFSLTSLVGKIVHKQISNYFRDTSLQWFTSLMENIFLKNKHFFSLQSLHLTQSLFHLKYSIEVYSLCLSYIACDMFCYLQNQNFTREDSHFNHQIHLFVDKYCIWSLEVQCNYRYYILKFEILIFLNYSNTFIFMKNQETLPGQRHLYVPYTLHMLYAGPVYYMG